MVDRRSWPPLSFPAFLSLLAEWDDLLPFSSVSAVASLVSHCAYSKLLTSCPPGPMFSSPPGPRSLLSPSLHSFIPAATRYQGTKLVAFPMGWPCRKPECQIAPMIAPAALCSWDEKWWPGSSCTWNGELYLDSWKPPPELQPVALFLCSCFFFPWFPLFIFKTPSQIEKQLLLDVCTVCSTPGRGSTPLHV